MKNFKRIKYKKERCLLSDTLPYEVPLVFSNKSFYDFIIKYNVAYDDVKEEVSWKNHNTDILNNLMQILFCLHDGNIKIIDNKCVYSLKDNKVHGDKIPYCFKITHPTNIFRELSIPHPLNQLMAVDFYDRYKEIILYYCSVSSFSIRKPARVAQYSYYKDSMHYNRLIKDDEHAYELDDSEYENLRSFFVYKEYSHIHKFYESELFNDCEKKYDNLVKLDISKCFDSIYTHSISWATLGVEQTKEAISLSKNTFSGKFDKLMQRINYNETNGIVIGPELSRIFAEVILQSIDNMIKNDLENLGIIENKDYKVFRYIDDYFVFYNKIKDKEVVIQTIQSNIRQYKLNLNTAKSIDYSKPIITEISIAKAKLSSLLNERLQFELKENKENILQLEGYINSQKLIRDFKVIVKESNVEYKSILNYTLTIIDNKCKNILKKYNKVASENKNQNSLIESLVNILKFVFFIYTVSPQISTTIRLCRLIGNILYFINRSNINQESQDLIKQYIFENICFILEKNKINQYAQVETVYLLLCVSELGNDYFIPEAILSTYFGIELEGESKTPELSYFLIISVLFYIKNKKVYKRLYNVIISSIKNKVAIKTSSHKKNTEIAMLVMDILACPYISKHFKEDILRKTYGINDANILNGMCTFRKNKKETQLWFTEWSKFNFLGSLYDKQSKEVY